MNSKNGKSTKFICPVCGFDQLDEPAYDKYKYPSYEICSCCGFEYGFTDLAKGYSFESYRKEWANNGYKFKWEADKPKEWNEAIALNQLENLRESHK